MESKSERIKEYIDRGVIAMYRADGSVYISWRLLESDPSDISFNVYRDVPSGSPVKLNANPIKSTTDFTDLSPVGVVGVVYYVRPIIDSSELSPSKTTAILNKKGEQFFSLNLKGDYSFYKVAVADLNGDGSYDYIIKQPRESIDPWGPIVGNWRPSEDTYKIEAYLSNGTFLWRKDLGWDIELGTWYSPYVAYDFDGDGKAEVAVKTGTGDHRDLTGKVRWGPEYLSIWNGLTGEEETRVAWPRRLPQMYNWYCRNQLGIAYLDGCRPYILAARGTYMTLQLEAYYYNQNRLESAWHWDSSQEWDYHYYGQGAHFMHSADVDSDGFDEVLLGACVINENGKGLWSADLQHPDHSYIGDINPERDGLEIYYGIEGIADVLPADDNGICLVDAATGEIIWGVNETTYHIHSTGLVSDIDPLHPGMECYSGEDEYPYRRLHAADGTLIANESTYDFGLSPRAVYWDADLQREVIYNNRIFDFETNYTHLEEIEGAQMIWADILGDWREEIIVALEGELRIYVTTIPAADRRVCLMQDPIYRLDVAMLSMGYSQLPTTSYCLDS